MNDNGLVASSVEQAWQAGYQAGQESVADQREEAWSAGYEQGKQDAQHVA